ncbi:protein smg5 [Lynx pardinus]|uniref:Nonsense-mediated mRNA decay factor SMG5 n=1 Tax=Lynx pardinus TaxID=191816 RepID=A0A485NS87_LYNPA|nr:protein smg5 [Lynx pardinus]
MCLQDTSGSRDWLLPAPASLHPVPLPAGASVLHRLDPRHRPPHRMQEASVCLREGDGLGTDGVPPMSHVPGGFVLLLQLHRVDSQTRGRFSETRHHGVFFLLSPAARYQNELAGVDTELLAERFYYQALSVAPQIGMPFNQLGTLAGSKYYNVEAMYCYLRCIQSEVSFEGAYGNLKRLYDKAAKMYHQLKKCETRKLSPSRKRCKDIKRLLVNFMYLQSLLQPRSSPRRGGSLRSLPCVPSSCRVRCQAGAVEDSGAAAPSQVQSVLSLDGPAALARRCFITAALRSTEKTLGSRPGTPLGVCLCLLAAGYSPSLVIKGGVVKGGDAGSCLHMGAPEWARGGSERCLPSTRALPAPKIQRVLPVVSPLPTKAAAGDELPILQVFHEPVPGLSCKLSRQLPLGLWPSPQTPGEVFALAPVPLPPQSSQSLWNRLSVLLNLLPAAGELQESGLALCPEVQDLLEGGELPDLPSSLLLPEDTALRNLPPLRAAHRRFNFDTDRPLLSALEESVVRICCIRSFGHFVARLQGSTLQFSAEAGIFVSIAQSEQEGVLPQAQAQIRMAQEEARRNRLMRDMAQLRLQLEVSQLEGSLQQPKAQSAMSPYLVPDTQALCHHLPVIRQLATSGRFIVIIPRTVIDGLDLLKKEHPGARDGIRYLEAEFKKGNRYIRCQKEVGKSFERHKLKRQDADAWTLYKILDSCKQLTLAQGAGEEDPSGMVTIVTGLPLDDPSALSGPMQAALQAAAHASVDIKNVLDFYKQWKEIG